MCRPAPDPRPDSDDRGSSAASIGMLPVLWRGDREVAIYKPAGLSSERPTRESSGDSSGVSFGVSSKSSPTGNRAALFDSALERAKSQFGWPEARLPHRLDRPTSGILMIAADSSRAADHAREIREKTWTKYYIARVDHQTSSGEASALIGRHKAYVRREGRFARCVRSGGDPASLEILAVAQPGDDPRTAHVLLRLETGRFHQIRVMLAHLGFPLVGDLDYGGRRWGGRRIDRSPSGLEPASQPSLGLKSPHSEGGGLELIAVGLRLDRHEGVTVITVPLESALGSRTLSESIVQKFAIALSTPASASPR